MATFIHPTSNFLSFRASLSPCVSEKPFVSTGNRFPRRCQVSRGALPGKASPLRHLSSGSTSFRTGTPVRTTYAGSTRSAAYTNRKRFISTPTRAQWEGKPGKPWSKSRGSRKDKRGSTSNTTLGTVAGGESRPVNSRGFQHRWQPADDIEWLSDRLSTFKLNAVKWPPPPTSIALKLPPPPPRLVLKIRFPPAQHDGSTGRHLFSLPHLEVSWQYDWDTFLDPLGVFTGHPRPPSSPPSIFGVTLPAVILPSAAEVAASLEGLQSHLSKASAFLPKAPKVPKVPRLSALTALVALGPTAAARSATSAVPILTPPVVRKKGFNPYLSGNFQRVATEQPRMLACQVRGAIPKELRGRLLRNGPNSQMEPDPDTYHWFDGDGMVHAVEFHEGGGVSYSSRYVRTTGWQEERRAGRPLFVGLAHGVSLQHVRVALMNALHLRNLDTPLWNAAKNVANNHLALHAGKLLALWEAGFPYELRLEDLSTKGVFRFNGQLSSSFTAHPKADPKTGELMYHGVNLLNQPHVSYGVVNAEGQISHTADIELPQPVLMHDFAITEHYTLIFDFPVRCQLAEFSRPNSTAKPFIFDEKQEARIGVLPRHGSAADMRWFTVKPGFVLHSLNAYEEEEEGGERDPETGKAATTVVLQAFRFDAFSALSLADLPAHLESYEVCRLHEYRLHLPSGTSSERSICPVCSDFPAINNAKLGSKSRFGYSSRFTVQPGPGNSVPSFNALLKHDLEEGTYQTHRFGPNRFGGEAVFVPRHQRPATVAAAQAPPKAPGGSKAVAGSGGIFSTVIPSTDTGGAAKASYARGDGGGTTFSARQVGELDGQLAGDVEVADTSKGEGADLAATRMKLEWLFRGLRQAPSSPSDARESATSASALADFSHPSSNFGDGSPSVGSSRGAAAVISPGGAKAVKGQTKTPSLACQGRRGGQGGKEEGGEEEEEEEGAEDDGWLLVHVWDEDEQQSELLVIDARNFEAPPVATVLMPRRVPFGFHGIFVPANGSSDGPTL